MRTLRAWKFLALLAAAQASCSRLPDEEAIGVVKGYDRALVEAYRTGDSRPLEGWAGRAEKNKVAALIGVKLDMGVTLDAHLLDLDVAGVERSGDEVQVITRERWSYLDRRIGTGAQVGDASTDRYRMQYYLGREGKRWVVLRVEFAEPPDVGRKETFQGDARILHGIDTMNPAQEKADSPGGSVAGPRPPPP